MDREDWRLSAWPNLRHLRAISLTARHASVKRAAAEMFLSQPAVTQAIANLESEHRQNFFDRTPGGMFLTRFGEVFCRRVERALTELSGGCGGAADDADRSRLLTAAQVRVVIGLSSTSNYEVAARALSMSRASIQRTTRSLEAALCLNLFVRSADGIRLTDAGLKLARAAKRARRELELASEELKQLEGQKVGRLVVGSLPLSLVEVVPLALMRLLDRMPDLTVRIVEGPYRQQLDRLLHADIDMMVGALRSPAPCDEVRQETLFVDQLHVVARHGHPLTRLKAPTLSDTVGYAWVLPPTATPTRQLFHEAFRRRALTEPKRLLEVSSHASLRSILTGSDRVALISRRQVRFEEEAGLLAVLPIDLPEATREIGLLTRADWAPSSAQTRFIDELRRLAAEYSADDATAKAEPAINRIRMGIFPAPG